METAQRALCIKREEQERFFDSYTSTALRNGYNPEDGSYTKPSSSHRMGATGSPAHISGRIFVREGREIEGWKDAAKRLTLGGERAYGSGKRWELSYQDSRQTHQTSGF